MSHDHSSPHSHAPANFNKAFAFGIALNVAYIIVEVVYGLSSKSLALLADAGHNLGDVLSLAMAWGAMRLALVAPTSQRTYGWRRTSILAALINALLLLVAIGAIAWEAIHRLGQPEEAIPGLTVMWVAGVGIIVNGATALLFMKGREKDLNVKGAFLHMAGDAGAAVGVVIAGYAIKTTGLPWIDPVVSLAIVVIIGFSTWKLLRDSVNLSLDAVPEGISRSEVDKFLTSLPGITAIHDVHIWSMSTTEIALTAHLVKPDGNLDDSLLRHIQHELHERFEIGHITIQFERGDMSDTCPQEPSEAI